MFKDLFIGNAKGKPRSKFEILEDYLTEKDIRFGTSDHDSGSRNIFIKEKLNAGPSVEITINFNKEETTACIYFNSYVHFSDVGKRYELLEECNAIHLEFIFTNFYLGDNEISMQYSVDISYGDGRELVFDQLITMLSMAERCYPRFMKALWS